MPKLLNTCAAAVCAMAISACAWAQADASNICGQKVNHVLVEQAHVSPPILIMPDVGAYGETPQQEWNNLGQTKDDITVHCFPNADKSSQTDVKLPAGTKRCVLDANGMMACGH